MGDGSDADSHSSQYTHHSPYGPMNHDRGSLISSRSANQVFQLLQALQKIQVSFLHSVQQAQVLQQRCHILSEQDRCLASIIVAIDPTGNISQQIQEDPTLPARSSVGLAPVMLHPTISDREAPRETTRKGNTLRVCRDFLKDRCERSQWSCRYAHIPSHLIAGAREYGTVIVCLDFLHNRCERKSCRFFHPPPHLTVNMAKRRSSTESGSQRYKRQRLSSTSESDDRGSLYVY